MPRSPARSQARSTRWAASHGATHRSRWARPSAVTRTWPRAHARAGWTDPRPFTTPRRYASGTTDRRLPAGGTSCGVTPRPTLLGVTYPRLTSRPPAETAMSDSDPFPRERLAASLRHSPAYGRLAWRLVRDPLLSKARRAALIAAFGYVASPVDAIPGVIPVLGQLDDLAIALAALRLALDGLTPSRRRAHLEAVGLDDATLADDARTVGVATAWLARAGARTAREAAVIGVHVGVDATRIAADVAGKSLRTTAHIGERTFASLRRRVKR